MAKNTTEYFLMVKVKACKKVFEMQINRECYEAACNLIDLLDVYDDSEIESIGVRMFGDKV